MKEHHKMNERGKTRAMLNHITRHTDTDDTDGFQKTYAYVRMYVRDKLLEFIRIRVYLYVFIKYVTLFKKVRHFPEETASFSPRK